MDYKTYFKSGRYVSTVFLPFGTIGGQRYETMVFPDKNNYGEEDCERYTLRDEAVKGHALIVSALVDAGEVIEKEAKK